MLEEFQQQLDEAAEALSVPRDATVVRRAATEELRSAFRRVDAVNENHFDPLLLLLRETHAEFHGHYRAARMLVNHPGRRPGSDKPEAPVTPPAAAAPAALLPTAQPKAA